MYNELAKALRRPALYQPSPLPFWEDEHISTYMLAAHLDPSWDAATRKHEFVQRSAAWIASLVPPAQAPALLDLGCGPGIYCNLFAQAGYAVTGIDFSKRSIDYALAHDARSTYLLGSYLEMDMENAFDLATLIYCDYGALRPDDRAQLLRRVWHALKPGGALLLDVFTPASYRDKKESHSWEQQAEGFWCGEPHILFDEELLYGDRVSVEHVVVLTEKAVKEYCIWDTAFTLPELTAELAAAGFAVEQAFADVAGAPRTGENDETLCVLARRG